MALTSLQDWVDSWDSAIQPTMGDFATPIASWLTLKALNLQLSSFPASSFTFSTNVFRDLFATATPTMDKNVAIDLIATAFSTALISSVMVVAGGVAVITNPNDAKNIFSNIMLNADINNPTKMPEAFRSGLLGLQYAVTIPPSGPVISGTT